jgi:hypothetical protein
MTRRRVRCRTSRRAATALALLATIVVGACAPGTNGPTFPPVGSTVAPVGDATAAVRAQVANALAVEGLQVVDAAVAYRPPEGARFAAAPRSVVQVTLPDDPTHGYIVLYAFPTPQAAVEAANDQAAYIASGPGLVQFQVDTQFVLRVSGSNAIFFTWSPENSPDPRTPTIALALSQVGTEVTIPG